MARSLVNTDPALRRRGHPVPRSGEAMRAFPDLCPHRHCPLTPADLVMAVEGGSV